MERKDVLLVKQISVDIKTNGYIPTQDFIGVAVDAVAKIRVKTDGDGIQIAVNYPSINWRACNKPKLTSLSASSTTLRENI